MAKFDLDVEAVSPDDLVIVIMGPTGSGKSHLIDTLMGQEGQRSGKSLKSCTDKVQAVQVPPATDMDILKVIGDWLAKTYGNDVKLVGIVYLHRITDNPMSSSPLKNLRMFGKLCGDAAARHVVFVSSMWDKVDPAVAQEREAVLKDSFWKGMLDNGASVDRFANSPESAWHIVRKVVQNKEERGALLLQEELVDLQRRLNETEAGKTLYTLLQKLLSDEQETIRKLAEQVASEANPELAKQLEAEHARLQKELDATFVQIKRLKIPFGRRVMMLFKFKKARGVNYRYVVRVCVDLTFL
ncbi:hypothetical protein JAAARDRAFT_197806 [Jaapia argillacea MUCL 33604]|uniref:G domain-containing protein n=1 Tax=Jaapia argillacea MUCL 33604 TaxID=933084 RepID=A0A067PRR6_9AGAM|nr:hypothetical protein JAAARDRAFT_197806 [Jaapia argillacea MUCL 33604]